jgi:hypothetical protein
MQSSKGLKTETKDLVRILITLACSLALVSAVYAQQENKQHKKNQTQSAQRAAKPTSHPAAIGGASKRTPTAATGAQKPTTGHISTAAYQPPKGQEASNFLHCLSSSEGEEERNPSCERNSQSDK